MGPANKNSVEALVACRRGTRLFDSGNEEDENEREDRNAYDHDHHEHACVSHRRRLRTLFGNRGLNWLSHVALELFRVRSLTSGHLGPASAFRACSGFRHAAPLALGCGKILVRLPGNLGGVTLCHPQIVLGADICPFALDLEPLLFLVSSLILGGCGHRKPSMFELARN
jgi:hypothetical protein